MKRGNHATAPHTHDLVERIDDESLPGATTGRWTVVNFWAAWCTPCRSFAPTFAEVFTRYQDRLSFAACDVEQNPRASCKLRIRSVPTIVAFDPEGNEVTRRRGPLTNDELGQLAEDVIQLAMNGGGRVP